MNQKRAVEIISNIVTALIVIAIYALIVAGAVGAVKLLFRANSW